MRDLLPPLAFFTPTWETYFRNATTVSREIGCGLLHLMDYNTTTVSRIIVHVVIFIYFARLPRGSATHFSAGSGNACYTTPITMAGSASLIRPPSWGVEAVLPSGRLSLRWTPTALHI